MRVVNIKAGFRRADHPDHMFELVVIMRPRILGNPFVMRSEADRELVIEQFRQHLWKDIQRNGPMKKELDRLRGCEKQGREVILMCCCKPAPCHGDIIINAVNWLNKQEVKT
jgi:hypothetical protein